MNPGFAVYLETPGEAGDVTEESLKLSRALEIKEVSGIALKNTGTIKPVNFRARAWMMEIQHLFRVILKLAG